MCNHLTWGRYFAGQQKRLSRRNKEPCSDVSDTRIWNHSPLEGRWAALMQNHNYPSVSIIPSRPTEDSLQTCRGSQICECALSNEKALEATDLLNPIPCQSLSNGRRNISQPGSLTIWLILAFTGVMQGHNCAAARDHGADVIRAMWAMQKGMLKMHLLTWLILKDRDTQEELSSVEG